MTPDLKKYFSVSEKISGCTLPKQAMLMAYILNRMLENNIRGDVLELGVMEGKSAVLFAMALKPKETLHLVDMRLSTTRDQLLQYIAETTDNEIGIDRLKLDARFSHELREDLSTLRGKYRLIHIDAGHGHTDVYRDLALADELLDREGVVIADDFFALGRPDVTEAVYEYVFANPASFRIFLVGFNKALLCRPDRLSRWWPDTLKNIVGWFKAHDSNVMVHQYGSPLEKCSMAVYDRAPDAPAYGGFLAKPECTALIEALAASNENK
ncbi:class I SAM-dependent methyltransferase [uncultured Roseibium sp.]|uniref:class I SAM-dependent methyltransferase n=1 Tax=uncultured Roseibium sp. TaxID=1936171 RepID=UPI00263A0A13|nr:class I SAM-dependent methyltransferase [uncultured Roseibium sp.]